MPSKHNLYLKARNNPAGLRYREFVTLIEAFGFEFKRQSGSHRMYHRGGVPELVNVQPTKGGTAKDYQVEQFLKIVARYDLNMEEV